MAFVNLSGVLTNSIGGIDVGATLKMTHLSTTGDTLSSTVTEIIIPPNGAYDIDLNFGIVRFDYTTEFTQVFLATTTINGDTTATTITELLNSVVPPTDPQLLLFQDILADAQTAETNAAASAAASATSAALSVPVLTLSDATVSTTAQNEDYVDISDLGMERFQYLTGQINDGDRIRPAAGGLSMVAKHRPLTKTAQVSRLKALIASGSLIMSVLGDSTEAGVGAGGGTYAQVTDERNNGWANYSFYYMAKSDGAFIDLVQGAADVALPFLVNSHEVSASLSLPYPSWQSKKSDSPTIEFLASNVSRDERNEFTVYLNERTSDAALTFRLTVRKQSDDSLLFQGTIDTYVAEETFGIAGSFVVSGRLAKRTVTLSSTERYVKVTLDQFDTVDRGTGQAADGTSGIYGFTFGNGIEFHNLSVASTTLQNSSAANITRGVTTTERLTLAQSFNSNAYIIGFGTNDSKSGISTEADFRAEYNQLIADILTTEPSAVIILSNDPRGKSGSIYEFNPAYNAIVRDISEERGFILLDVEKMSDTLPSDFYDDDVHPSSIGVYQLMQAFTDEVGVERESFAFSAPLPALSVVAAGEFEITATTAVPTSLTELLSETIPTNSAATFLILSVHVVLKDAANSNINTTGILKVNGVQVDTKRVATVDASGTARQEMVMHKVYDFGTSPTYDISVEFVDNTGNGTTTVQDRATVSFLWV